MPEKYLKIKKSLIKRGEKRDNAERIAAAIYNKERKPGQKPVTPSYEKKKRR